MTVDVWGTENHILNNGWIVIDDGIAKSAPTFDWYGKTFENNGQVWFAGIGNTGGSTFAIQPKGTFLNRGTISLYQYNSRKGGTSHLGFDDKTITNDGTVCIYQNIFFQGSIVQGNGCWDVGLDSNFWATNVKTRYMSEGQIIYLSTTASSIRIDCYPPNVPIHIAGWGNNNVIGLSSCIDNFRYDGVNLFLTHGSYIYQIVIGPGYDPTLMRIGQANYGSGVGTISKAGILYSGPVPHGRPSQCNECPPPPRAPTDTLDPTTTQKTTQTTSNSQTTISSSWTGSTTKTVTATDTAGGIDTVIVEIPSATQTQTQTQAQTTPQITIISTWTGTITTTITEIDTVGGTDTVVVVVPPSGVDPVTKYITTSVVQTVTTTTTGTSTLPRVTVTVTKTKGT